ncbi:hypothetical protein GCM10017690_08070 [Microbacterium terregens]
MNAGRQPDRPVASRSRRALGIRVSPLTRVTLAARARADFVLAARPRTLGTPR